MSRFGGIENAKTSDKLPNIMPGRYVLEVTGVKVIATRAKGDMFISEFKVLENGGTAGENPVGSTCSHLIKLSLDSAMGNVKGFVQALTGEAKVTSDLVDGLVSPENPAAGTKVRAEAFMIKTKAGADFTKVNYSHFSEEA